MKKTLYTFSLLLLSISSFALIRLPNILSGNMVLQQNAKVKLWGWANPKERVVITTSWDNHMDTIVVDKNSVFEAIVQTPSAGGPYTITFSGSNKIVLDNIMLGEVWLCGGQSNMEYGNAQKIQQMVEELPTANYPNIRLFFVEKSSSVYPQDNLFGTWKPCTPENLKNFSAIGYFFGKKLHEDLSVPIGLIGSYISGTPAEIWTPEEEIKKDSMLSEIYLPKKPGRTYNSMIYPLSKFTIKGVLWYQGESNVNQASSYKNLFISLINGWRKAWDSAFPFYYVQLAPFQGENKNVTALLREAQLQALSTPGTGMVVTTDLADDVKNIHPQKKREVAVRLANIALADTYGKRDIPFQSPLYKSMKVDKDKVYLYFEHALNGFISKNGKPTDFFIAGSDQQFVAASVRLEKDRIVVYSKEVKTPVAVRFGFSNAARPNLFSKENLPVSPFRTDDWAVDTSAEEK